MTGMYLIGNAYAGPTATRMAIPESRVLSLEAKISEPQIVVAMWQHADGGVEWLGLTEARIVTSAEAMRFLRGDTQPEKKL